MKFSTITNAVVSPYQIKGDIFQGGIKDSPDYGRIMRKTGKFADEWLDAYGNKNGELRLKGHYLYAGPFYNHFGHIMTESIHRLFAFNNSYDGVVFCSAGHTNNTIMSQDPPKYFFDILQYFGVSPDKVVILREMTSIEQLDVFEPGSRLQHGATTEYLEKLKEIRRRNSLTTDKCLPKKVYFGRSHIIEGGTLLGESYFLTILLENGFEYIAPEKYSVFEQIQILENAEEVIFLEGSSIYALELIPSINAKVYMLPRRPYDSFFRPHIEGKARFNLLGELESMVRIGNMNRLIRPSSPTLCMKPEIIHEEMINNNLVHDNIFSLSSFMSFVKYDLLRYSSKDNNRYSEMLIELDSYYRESKLK